MDTEQRHELITRARLAAEQNVTRVEQAQADHCDALERLESQGVDLAALTELYGDAVLTPSGADQVKRLGRILDALNGPASSTLVVGSTEIGHDTSVTHSTRNVIKAKFALFEDPTRCRLEFLRDEDNQLVSLVIKGIGYKAVDRTYSPILPDPEEDPTEIEFVLTQRYYGDNIGLRVLSGRDYNLVESAETEGPEGNIQSIPDTISRLYLLGNTRLSPALNWLGMDYLTPQERQRVRDKNKPDINVM